MSKPRKKLAELIPSNVRITKDASYEVLWTEEFLKDKHQLGECRNDPRQIVINKNQSDTESYRSYLHELMHALNFEHSDLALTHKQIYSLEKILFRVLKLNGVFDLLTKR